MEASGLTLSVLRNRRTANPIEVPVATPITACENIQACIARDYTQPTDTPERDSPKCPLLLVSLPTSYGPVYCDASHPPYTEMILSQGAHPSAAAAALATMHAQGLLESPKGALSGHSFPSLSSVEIAAPFYHMSLPATQAISPLWRGEPQNNSCW
jgi:hypothetical protein